MCKYIYEYVIRHGKEITPDQSAKAIIDPVCMLYKTDYRDQCAQACADHPHVSYQSQELYHFTFEELACFLTLCIAEFFALTIEIKPAAIIVEQNSFICQLSTQKWKGCGGNQGLGSILGTFLKAKKKQNKKSARDSCWSGIYMMQSGKKTIQFKSVWMCIICIFNS